MSDLRRKLEDSFDPSDTDAAQMLAIQALKLMKLMERAIKDDEAGLRLGRDQKGDMHSAVIEVAARLGLLTFDYTAKDIEAFLSQLEQS